MIKFGNWETKFEKNLHHGFDKSADLHPYFNKIGALYDILMTVIWFQVVSDKNQHRRSQTCRDMEIIPTIFGRSIHSIKWSRLCPPIVWCRSESNVMDLEGKKTSCFFDNFKEKRSLCGGLRVKEPRKASKIRAKRKSSKDGSRTNNKWLN